MIPSWLLNKELPEKVPNSWSFDIQICNFLSGIADSTVKFDYKTSVLLKNCKVEDKEGTIFHVVDTSTPDKIYMWKAESAYEKQLWTKAIQSAIDALKTKK